ncbi:hypothetical protein ACFYXP_33570, partial [Streptomyces sp. NPDC002466]|uniref:hypothetical protein n=1 Tax=Streptomyces sp. NPDC002466 TaxID=3364646 RepID=UPI0036B70C66
MVFDFARRYGWGQAHAESGCELGEGVTAAKVGQGRQRLGSVRRIMRPYDLIVIDLQIRRENGTIEARA